MVPDNNINFEVMPTITSTAESINNPYLGHLERSTQMLNPKMSLASEIEPNATVSFSGLHDPYKKRIPVSMGLSMPNSVSHVDKEASADVMTQANRTPQDVAVSFGNLVTPVYKESSNRFGVQPLAEDVDRSMLPKPITEEDIKAANERLNKAEQVSSKKVNNWFSRLLDQRGQDYISSGKLTIDEVSKNAERIIDDMIAGRIDYDKYGQYIVNPVVIQTLVNYCSNKLAINKALQFSLGYTYNDYSTKTDLTDDPERYITLSGIDDGLARNMAQSISIVNQDIGLYSILYNKLLYVNNTKNASSLFSLTNELNNYKKQMRKRY
jgi:hypothetical protein